MMNHHSETTEGPKKSPPSSCGPTTKMKTTPRSEATTGGCRRRRQCTKPSRQAGIVITTVAATCTAAAIAWMVLYHYYSNHHHHHHSALFSCRWLLRPHQDDDDHSSSFLLAATNTTTITAYRPLGGPSQQQQQQQQSRRAMATSLVVYAVNAAGPDVDTGGGLIWRGDLDWPSPSQSSDPLGQIVLYPNCTQFPLSLLPFGSLYCTLRNGPVRYTLTGIAPSTSSSSSDSNSNNYSIDFLFLADTTTRRFNIWVQGLLKASDWTRNRLPYTPYTVTVDDISVVSSDNNNNNSGGTINITFETIGNPPLLAAFRVRSSSSSSAVPVPPPPPVLTSPLWSVLTALSPPPGGPSVVTYRPGNLSVHDTTTRLLLSEGLSVRLVAQSGQPIRLYQDNSNNNGSASSSTEPFHRLPDGAATYPDPRAYNNGGWVYVSNSEVRPVNGTNNDDGGGVGAITFDRQGRPVAYQMLLRNTKRNCGGGKTPWGAWISGEEHPHTGRIWQVDPFDNHPPVPITMGETNRGLFESFAYDNRNVNQPRLYMTKDHEAGALRRLYVCGNAYCCCCCCYTLLWLLACCECGCSCFISVFDSTPNTVTGVDPWQILTQPGVIEYLQLVPGASDNSTGTFRWTLNVTTGNDSARNHFVRNSHFVSQHYLSISDMCARDGILFAIRSLTHSYPPLLASFLV
jgi:Bacterial protein of unknown function (DUF839)